MSALFKATAAVLHLGDIEFAAVGEDGEAAVAGSAPPAKSSTTPAASGKDVAYTRGGTHTHLGNNYGKGNGAFRGVAVFVPCMRFGVVQ